MNEREYGGALAVPSSSAIADDAPARQRRADRRAAVDPLVADLAERLQTTAAVFEQRGRTVRSIASAVRHVALPPIAEAQSLVAIAPASPARGTTIAIESGRWTVVPVSSHGGRSWLVLHGDFGAVPEVIAAAAQIGRALDADALDRSSRCQAATHALARRLARAEGLARLCDLAAASAARLLDARVASVAVLDPAANVLRVHGTYGYPKLLVEHARIRPGQGIIGSVFLSGAPLCVPDVRAHAELHRNRPRYRTTSFVAVPVRAGDRTLGVICVTDRGDDRPFAHGDVSMVRALAAPFALALAREFAAGEAEQYAHAAAIDPVSNLFNRRYLHVRLEEELERARRHQIPLALLMVDIDDFKLINDGFGHLAGDTVIREAAAIVRRTVRMFDVCTRYGGDEFAILMPNSGAQSASTVAERIRRRIESYRFADPALASVSVTVSIGLAVSAAHLLPRDLIERADQALYEAKRLGKNRVWFV